jgi:hypothetical protein
LVVVRAVPRGSESAEGLSVVLRIHRGEMENWIAGILGILLLLLVFADAVWTTLSVNYAGPLASRLLDWLFMAFRKLTSGAGSYRRIWVFGPFCMIVTLGGWLFLAWLGWVLLFSSQPGAVLDTDSLRPADFWSRAYFAGYSFITLGVGDFRPAGGVWQVATVLAAINGFVLVTLSVSYLVVVMQAVVSTRQLALYISLLGDTSEDLLVRSWNGKDFGALGQHLVTLTPMLAHLSQQHLAYPVLHYFFSAQPETSVSMRITRLDDALSLLLLAVAPSHRPSIQLVEPIRAAVWNYIKTISKEFVEAAEETPALPDLAKLRKAGIPTVDDRQFRQELRALEPRRRLLYGLIKQAGFRWDETGGES